MSRFCGQKTDDNDNMKKELLRNIGIYAGIILLFAGLSYGFMPDLLGGKIVNQSDISGWKGMAQEALQHNEAHPEDPTAWTGSMFGGMPTTAMIDDFEGDLTDPLYKLLLLGKRPATYLFVALVGAFLLMLSMGMNRLVAVAGAIAVAFCSYNFQITQVGHNTKMQAIAFLPWVLAGVIFTYRAALGRRKWLPKTMLGSVLFALALSMQIKANHIQITYYLAIVIFIYAIALLTSLCIDKAKRTQLGRFFAASGLLLVMGCIGIATNANKLIPTYEYTPYTMRGGSELTSDSKSHNSKGLDLEYATAWSYSPGEMMNLMIPNFNGGSSAGAMNPDDSEVYDLLKRAGQPHLKETMKALPLYWGPQPFTAGPMYMGAISIFLFMLGLFLCRGRDKWWMLAATVIAIMLSWGSNAMWFTKLWFDYAPFYNKFRTVSMALVVLQVTIPLLGFYALDKVLKEDFSKIRLKRALIMSFGLAGGLCLVFALVPSLAGTFTGAVDNGQPDILVDALIADRQTLLKADAWRSFFFIAAISGLIAWTRLSKQPTQTRVRNGIAASAVILLVLLDLWAVGKRYLNSDHFVSKRSFTAQYNLRPVDKIILEDTDPDYRVLDLSVNTFNSATPSYHHKTIGGYSPVKMQRYQDLIDRYIQKEIRQIYDVIGQAETVQEVEDGLPELKIVSMLNGRYIILDGNMSPVLNKGAMGHCWFVNDAVPAATPDEEIALIGNTDLRTTAVIGNDFEWAQKAVMSSVPSVMSSEVGTSPDHITLTHYAPNELRYDFSTDSERPAVFSEVFYPEGWKAWIEPAGAYGKVVDGRYRPTPEARPLDIFRADWILRAAMIPEGEGTIVMRFEPDSYSVGKTVSRASSITLLILLVLSLAGVATESFWNKEHRLRIN